MPQTIHTGIKALIDAADAEIETISAADAIKIAHDGDVVIVDIRDPREIERDGKIPGAFSCTRGMLEFWIDPASPYAKPIFQAGQEIHLPLCRRHALGARRQDRAGHGAEAGRSYGRRLCRLARRRRADRAVGAEEEGVRGSWPPPSCPALCRASTSLRDASEDVDGRDEPGHDDAERISPNDRHRRSAGLHRLAR